MRLEFLFLILCLLLPAGLDLTAQNSQDSLPEKLRSTSDKLKSTLMSEDGTWLTLRKRTIYPFLGENNPDNDTILIFDLRNARVITKREQVNDISFVGTTHLLLSNAFQTELFNLKEQKSIYFEGVKTYQLQQNKKQLLLLYNKDGNNRLELRDSCGTLLKIINNVSLFSMTNNGHLYSVSDSEKSNNTNTIYSTSQKVLSFYVDPEEKGLIIHVQNPDDNTYDVLYLDLITQACYSLKEVLPIPFKSTSSEPIKGENAFYLNLCIDSQKADTSIVDIWNGNDNKLEEKFYSLNTDVNYIWEPIIRKVQRIGSNTLVNNANIGSKRYFLSCDPYQLQDYTKPTPLQINVYDKLKNTYSIIDTITSGMDVSPGGNYVLYPKNGSWYIYHISIGLKNVFGDARLKEPCFNADGKTVIFGGEDGLWSYDQQRNKLIKLDYFKGFRVSIINASSTYTSGYKMYEQKIFDNEKPLILELYAENTNKTTYLLWENGKTDTIIPLTGRYIKYLKYDSAYTHFSYVEEDYNLPPRLIYKAICQKEKVIYQSNKSDTTALHLRQEIIHFANSNGIQLTGTLYYPLHFNALCKYPMVVNIYEKQYHLSNHFLYTSYNDALGFNIRLFLEKGYFVYLPDIVTGSKNGPGLDALDCVNKSLDAIANNRLIDIHKIGLIGHSFGGYETDFIATHSNRFAAYVSGSGHSDIIWYYHTFSYNFFWPEYRRVEAGQYKMGVPFSADKLRYCENNPIFFAENVNAPMLLWSGMEDKNVTSDNSMAFYNALRRNGKNVIALYYKGEEHDLQSARSQNDLTFRVLNWFDYFLKGDTGIEWISHGIKVDKKSMCQK